MTEVARSETKDRLGWRPLLPSRATYWFWFGLAAILVFGMFPYLIWALARGLLDWTELWALEGTFVIFGGISLAIGLIFRLRWLRKRAAVLAYEQMLSSIATTNGS